MLVWLTTSLHGLSGWAASFNPNLNLTTAFWAEGLFTWGENLASYAGAEQPAARSACKSAAGLQRDGAAGHFPLYEL